MRSLTTLHQKCDRSHSTPEMRSLFTLHQKCDSCGALRYRS
ncbi:MAG: hypothetical protein ACK513_12710 [Aphanizomenon sp.]